MRDGINVTLAGRAAVVFVHDCFEKVARVQARGMGITDLKFMVYPQYTPGQLSTQIEQYKATLSARDFPKLLLEQAG